VRFSWKRWRLPLVAVLTVVATSLTFTGEAFAAEPGESGSWNEEYVGTNPLEVQGTVSEARNGGELLQVWRGATNNMVWLSVDNEAPFSLYNPDGSATATYVSPTVVPYGTNQFMVLHTGTDNNIYYTIVDPTDNTWSGSWTAVPYQSTNMTVSVTQLGSGSTQLYMVYHSSNDDRVWGTLYDGYGWQGAQNIDGGNSPSAPSVTYQPTTGLTVAVRGEDNQVWMTGASSPYNQWSTWAAQGGYTQTAPSVTADSQTGTVLVSYVDENSYRPFYRAYGVYGNPLGGWSQDITGWQTVNTVFLSVVGAAIYAVLTGLNGNVYYKQVYYN
jgi:hypothetical protein